METHSSQPVPQLATEATFEKVVALLWDSPLTAPAPQMCTWVETFV